MRRSSSDSVLGSPTRLASGAEAYFGQLQGRLAGGQSYLPDFVPMPDLGALPAMPGMPEANAFGMSAYTPLRVPDEYSSVSMLNDLGGIGGWYLGGYGGAPMHPAQGPCSPIQQAGQHYPQLHTSDASARTVGGCVGGYGGGAFPVPRYPQLPTAELGYAANSRANFAGGVSGKAGLPAQGLLRGPLDPCRFASKAAAPPALAAPPMRAAPTAVSLSQGHSRGSVGHPQLCNRPCVHMLIGYCDLGPACDFCHMGHPKRPVHLDKRHRELLRDVPPQEWLVVVLPILYDKIRTFDWSAQMQALVAELSVYCSAIRKEPMASDAEQKSLTSRSRRTLAAVMRSMTLKSVLSTLQHAAQAHGVPLCPFIDNLLHRLREQAMVPVLG